MVDCLKLLLYDIEIKCCKHIKTVKNVTQPHIQYNCCYAWGTTCMRLCHSVCHRVNFALIGLLPGSWKKWMPSVRRLMGNWGANLLLSQDYKFYCVGCIRWMCSQSLGMDYRTLYCIFVGKKLNIIQNGFTLWFQNYNFYGYIILHFKAM